MNWRRVGFMEVSGGWAGVAVKKGSERQRDGAISNRIDQLTQREREVMKLVVAGKLNKQVADELNISMKTVEAHRARVIEKMGVRTLAELVKAVMTVH